MMLQNADIIAFFVAQESFYQRATEVVLERWAAKIEEHKTWEQSVIKTAFAIFIIGFYLIEFLIVPRIIK